MRRFLWKLYGAYAALILLTTATVGVLVTRQIEADALDDIRDSLTARASLLREIPDAPDLQPRVRAMGASTGTRLTVIDADGTVLADSAEDPADMDNHGSRPEVLDARDRAVGTTTRFSTTTHEHTMYVALTRPGGGFVRAALPLTAVGERMARVRSAVALGAGVSTLVALGVGWLFARRVTRPLETMTAAAQSIADGRFDQRVATDSRDEIGALAAAFNRMAEQLRDRIAAIEREQSELRATVGGMVEGVISVDAAERILQINEAAARIVGDGTGRPLAEVVRVPAIHELLRRTLAERRPQAGEARLPTHGEDQVVLLHGAPIHGGGAVLVMHDVTELRRLETIRRDFVANVSHELKTPLTAIQGFVETILDDPSMDADTKRRYLDRAREQARRLSALVADLLTLSRIESGDGLAAPEPVDVAGPLRAAFEALAPAAKSKGLAFELTAEPAVVAGDEDALRQVFENLLDNAIKYTPEGGRVSAALRIDGGDAVVEVRDTGIGIAPRDQERVFERFYRVDRARSRALGGTGLGLSIVKHIVQAHGGGVAVESAPGAGSVFSVRIPLTAR